MLFKLLNIIFELIILPYLVIFSIYSRYKKKNIDIGIGPDPLINSINHKKALEIYGYSVETFTVKPYYITNEFDIILNNKYKLNSLFGKIMIQFSLIRLAFKYKCLYFYFNGGPLSFSNNSMIFWRIEPFLYKISKIKTVLFPYGSDIQMMQFSKNLYFKHTMNKDYPKHRFKKDILIKKLDLWTRNADHIISGCEWVDYMYYWDTLMLAHFSIEIKQLLKKNNDDKIFKILHAPNHRYIKGTNHLINIIKDLKKEKYNIELFLIEGKTNKEIINEIHNVDLIADQFVIGWYAMFTIEAMVCEKPVLCYLRKDLIELYEKAGLIDRDEIPIINTSLLEIKDKIIWAYNNREKLYNIGKKSRDFIINHHSNEYIGSIFDGINKQLGLKK